MGPARDWGEMELELLAMGPITGIGSIATSCCPLTGSRDPAPDQRAPFDQRTGGVDSRPVFRIPNEAFLNSLSQVITQPDRNASDTFSDTFEYAP